MTVNVNSSCCEVFDGDETKCYTISTVRWILSIFSIVGCLFVIFVIVLFRRYTAFNQRCILYLSIGAILNGIGKIMQGGLQVNEDGPWCDFIGWFATFTIWIMLLWLWAITINLFLLVTFGIKTEKKEWL